MPPVYVRAFHIKVFIEGHALGAKKKMCVHELEVGVVASTHYLTAK